jgi:hypothetical protein
MFLAEEGKLVSVLRPIDSTGAAFTTEWISLKNYPDADFIINLGAMTSTSAQAVTLKVADDASGTHSAVITSASAQCLLTLPFYHKTTSGDTLAKVSVSSSTFNLTASSDAKYVVVHVDGGHMGTFIDTSVTYDADYVAISVATPGAHACLANVDCLLTGGRHKSASPPTAIT